MKNEEGQGQEWKFVFNAKSKMMLSLLVSVQQGQHTELIDRGSTFDEEL